MSFTQVMDSVTRGFEAAGVIVLPAADEPESGG